MILLLACLEAQEVTPAPVELGTSEVIPVGYRVATVDTLEGPFLNRLAEASSPYLQQHANNPVDWYEWGPEAWARARELEVPIFLSIGYAACHWCHVMAHESFEDPKVALFMNEHFVNIKVDREERPDVDGVYMQAVHALNEGNGGWPASIWLETDLRPFHAGTYYPSEPSYGRPSFIQMLELVDSIWRTDRARIRRVAESVEAGLTAEAIPARAELPGTDLGAITADQMRAQWDPVNQGFGPDKKFPMAPRLDFLLAHAARTDDVDTQGLVRGALTAMADGGIHDHLGGGFHRYTVDPAWTIPHFEKMLYDNAQLVGLYAQASVVLGQQRYAEVSRDTATYLIRDMQDASGAFYSSEDADSAGEEGSFYVWTPTEVVAVLGPEEGPRFNAAFGVTEEGNFEHGTTVLTRQGDEDFAEARLLLFTHRLGRTPPPTDTKQVVAWNGLAIGGLALSGRLLDEPTHVEAARRAAEAVLAYQGADGRLPRTLAPNPPEGTLSDYSFFAEGLLHLYEADPDPRWLLAAELTAKAMVERFQSDSGGFYEAPEEADELFVRRQDPSDGAEPSGWGRAVVVLLRLHAYGSAVGDIDKAEAALEAAGLYLHRAPYAVPSMVLAHDALRRPSLEVILASPTADDPVLAMFRRAYDNSHRPDAVLGVVTPETATDLAHMTAFSGKVPGAGPRAYVCVDKVCHLPTEDLAEFIGQLEATLDYSSER